MYAQGHPALEKMLAKWMLILKKKICHSDFKNTIAKFMLISIINHS